MALEDTSNESIIVPDKRIVYEYVVRRGDHDPLLAIKMAQVIAETDESGSAVTGSFGMPLHSKTPLSKEWTIVLDSSAEDVRTQMLTTMGNIYFNAVKEVLVELDLTGSVSDMDLAIVLQSLASNGRNIDSFIAEELETLEIARISGSLPESVEIFGTVP